MCIHWLSVFGEHACVGTAGSSTYCMYTLSADTLLAHTVQSQSFMYCAIILESHIVGWEPCYSLHVHSVFRSGGVPCEGGVAFSHNVTYFTVHVYYD